MGSSLGGLVSYYYFKIPSSVGKRESSVLWFSDKIFDLTEKTQKNKQQNLSYVAIMKVKIWLQT
jgi:hypothetical protein